MKKETDLLLGKHTDYPTKYCPELLQPISRLIARENLPFGMNLGKGFDAWHVFEVSWLDGTGKPQVAILRLIVPANSPNIVESKSLKLYFNGFNFEKFNTLDALISVIKKDLHHVVKANIKIETYNVEALPTQTVSQMHPLAVLIDGCQLSESNDVIFALADQGNNLKLLKHEAGVEVEAEVVEKLYSHLLRSNCPVTNQPDWGTVLIQYQGAKIDKSALLSYICSYREHNGFHEQCVEQIYADILTALKPRKLMVQAWYTRRGGIDISPCRASDTSWIAQASRICRQ